MWTGQQASRPECIPEPSCCGDRLVRQQRCEIVNRLDFGATAIVSPLDNTEHTSQCAVLQ